MLYLFYFFKFSTYVVLELLFISDRLLYPYEETYGRSVQRLCIQILRISLIFRYTHSFTEGNHVVFRIRSLFDVRCSHFQHAVVSCTTTFTCYILTYFTYFLLLLASCLEAIRSAWGRGFIYLVKKDEITW